MIEQFPWISSRELMDGFGISKKIAFNLRAKLPIGIYWVRVCERSIRWNKRLILDYLVQGPRPEHNALVEAYVHQVQTLSAVKAPSHGKTEKNPRRNRGH